KKFLETCFKYLPSDGQVNLSEDVSGCHNDDELRQLAASIDAGLLRPLLSTSGKTPVITPSPRISFDDSVEDLNSLDITPGNRTDQERLRRNCLRRDGFRIVTLTSHDGRFPLPEVQYLQLHAAVGNILHASGRAESIEKLIRHLEESDSSVLAKDGSTNISDLLSVSDLSC
ncbi:uncharacterized protein N7518_007594, partial [Penicillium psychrosexuale]|uniref:uncharacterized protein n=1 Tax=Penicillium psychrosexuale TaxID=1002107 RepID=UPI002545B396